MSTYSVISLVDESSPQGLETAGKARHLRVRFPDAEQAPKGVHPGPSHLATRTHPGRQQGPTRGGNSPQYCYQRRHAQALTSRKATPDWAAPMRASGHRARIKRSSR